MVASVGRGLEKIEKIEKCFSIFLGRRAYGGVRSCARRRARGVARAARGAGVLACRTPPTPPPFWRALRVLRPPPTLPLALGRHGCLCPCSALELHIPLHLVCTSSAPTAVRILSAPAGVVGGCGPAAPELDRREHGRASAAAKVGSLELGATLRNALEFGSRCLSGLGVGPPLVVLVGRSAIGV